MDGSFHRCVSHLTLIRVPLWWLINLSEEKSKFNNKTTAPQKLILLKPDVATYVRVTVYSSNHNIETAFFQSLFLIYFSSRGSDQGICAINSDYNIF